MKHATRLQKGFTLIELLVVIAIIGILAGMILGAFSSARNRAKDARVKTGLAQLATQAEVYYAGPAANSSYSDGSAEGVGTMTTGGAGTGLVGACNDASNLLVDIAAQAGNTATCTVGLNGGSFVAFVVLNEPTTNMSYCVDSSGARGEVLTSGINNTATADVSCS